jgi:hypothetical protein
LDGFDGSGIGSSYAQYGNSTVNSLTIENGIFNIIVASGSGIGSSHVWHGNSTVGSIIIRGGTFSIEVSQAAGIGAGAGSSGISYVGSLSLYGGTYNVTANSAAAIGAGVGEQGNSSVGVLTVAAGRFNITGQTGLGGSRQGRVGLLTFKGSASDEVIINCRTTRLFCFSADSLGGETVPVNATTNSPMFIEAGWGAATDLRGLNFVGTYLRTTEKDSFGNAPLLHIGEISGYAPGLYYVTLIGGGTRKVIPYDTSVAKGIVASVPVGTYTVGVARNLASNGETLCNAGMSSQFAVGQGETWVGNLGICSESAAQGGALSAGAAAGIAIGVIAFVAIAAAVVFFVLGGSNICAAIRARAALDTGSAPTGYTAAAGDI